MPVVVVRVDLNISLDGFATTTDGTPESPYGEDWGRLVEHWAATRTFQQRVLGRTDGAGTTGVDDRYAREYFEGVGAEVMGAGMFGLHLHPGDESWTGWWGDEPPFGCPVLVLTHERRPDLAMAGGTTFRFVSGSTQEVLQRALVEADGGDVRVGGGITVVREFLEADLVDRLHVGIVPILLGRGEQLWAGLRGLERTHRVTTERAESGVLHVVFER